MFTFYYCLSLAMSDSIFDSRNIHIGHLNVYHLYNKVPDLSVFLTRPSPFHLFGVTESRLHSSISDDAVSIPNFHVYRRDAGRHRDTGIAVYVHTSIQHFTKRRTDLESSMVESVWLELRAHKATPLLVCFLYRNPSSTLEWYDDFTQMLDTAHHSGAEILILGDININMLVPNPIWETTTALFGLKQLINTPTRVTASSSTLLDHIYTNNKSRVLGTHVAEIGISDHYAVCCNWALKVDKTTRTHQHTTITYRSLKRFDKDAFLADLSTVPFDSVYNHADPDAALATWYSLFLSVLDRHAPVRRKRVKSQRLPPWLNADIRQAMELRNQFKRDKDFPAYRKQRNLVRYLVRKAQRDLFQRLIDDKKDVVTVWRALNAFTKTKRKPAGTAITAEAFNRHFLSAPELLLQNTDPSKLKMSDKLTNFCNNRLSEETSFNVPLLTVFDVGKNISQLKNKRTSGHDDISSAVLKLALPYIVNSLTYIYNICIQQCKFPYSLKKAKVIPLPKSKNPSNPNNYRPISLLPVLSKPIERHIHTSVQKYLEDHSLLHPLQSGFRKRHSCHTALVHLIDRWLGAINRSEMTGVIFLDLSKAFDLVNHNLLIQKLSAYHFSQGSVSLFQSYLDNRTQYVVVNGQTSSEVSINHGVPQGSILGPLLFSVFINDLPLHITCPDVTCSLFADDGTLDVSSPSVANIADVLQQSLTEVSQWCSKNSMVPNIQKTKCMLVTTRQKHQLKPPPLILSLYNERIEQVKEHRVLGVVVDEQLCWQPHTDRLCKALSKNLFLLAKLRQFTDETARKLFYNAYILPYIDYSSTIWDSCSEANLKRLNSLHRRAAKLVIGRDKVPNNTDDKLKLLGMLPLKKQLFLNKMVFMQKAILGQTPAYISDQFRFSSPPYESLKNSLYVPRPRVDIYKTSLSYSGAEAWNKLPKTLKSARSVASFRARLYRYLLLYEPP